MTETTTIQITIRTKHRLDKRKTDGESYDTAVNRALDGTGVLWTEEEIRGLVERVIEDYRTV